MDPVDIGSLVFLVVFKLLFAKPLFQMQTPNYMDSRQKIPNENNESSSRLRQLCEADRFCELGLRRLIVYGTIDFGLHLSF